jgi:hypothetical protein
MPRVLCKKKSKQACPKRRAALIDAARRTGLVAADGSPGDGAGHPRATNPLMQIGVLSSEFSSKYLLRGPRFLKSLGQRGPLLGRTGTREPLR